MNNVLIETIFVIAYFSKFMLSVIAFKIQNMLFHGHPCGNINAKYI